MKCFFVVSWHSFILIIVFNNSSSTDWLLMEGATESVVRQYLYNIATQVKTIYSLKIY